MNRKKIIAASLAAIMLLASLPVPSRAQSSGDAQVTFTFDQADLRLIIEAVGKMTGRRFVIDEQVKGNVTVTPGNIARTNAYPLLLDILESSGFTVIEKAGVSHVVPLPDTSTDLAPFVGADEEPGPGINTKMFMLKHVSAVEMANLLRPIVRGGQTGAVTASADTNYLIITGTGDTIRHIGKMIREIDVPGASKTMEVMPLQHADADELAGQLIAAMRGAETSGENVSRHLQRVGGGMGALPSDMVIVPVRNANSLVVVGTPTQLVQVRDIITKIDIPTPVEFGRLNSIYLKYMSAEEAATTLNALLAKTAPKEQLARIAIEHNNANNALIIEAAPPDFELVRKLVEDLDRMPQQVMVEVVIAEVSMGEGFDLGVEWNTIDAPAEGETTAVGRSRPGDTDTLANILETGAFPQGIAVGVARGTYIDAAGQVLPRIPFVVQALAKDRDVKILSNIPLWAQNNTEASVSVVENIPILSSRIEGTGDNRDVIQNIERIDVGIKLKLTPHINADNEVKLKLNPSIEAITDSGPPDTSFAPTIAKREVDTTITVPDRATVVISGLIREDEINVVNKVPFLGDLPLIGWLFRSTSNQKQRTNLLIFVTPNIIRDLNDAEAVRASLQARTSINVTSAIPVAAESGKVP